MKPLALAERPVLFLFSPFLVPSELLPFVFAALVEQVSALDFA